MFCFLVRISTYHDVLVQQKPVVVPLCEEVAGDLDSVLDVVDLADVEAVETWIVF